MRISKRCGSHRRMLVSVVMVSLLIIIWPWFKKEAVSPQVWHVDPEHRQRVHSYANSVLGGKCRSGNARHILLPKSSASNNETQPFLGKKTPLPDDLFSLPPPFGFNGLKDKLQDLLKLLPESDTSVWKGEEKRCRRCVVVGNGGILRGLELGPLINKFDTIIRLNSGPLGGDVGNQTNIRMSYPEGTPHRWADTDPRTLFVAVVYKAVDIRWISAMINRHSVHFWDKLFFWQKVPDHVPLEPKMFRVLNLDVIRKTAMDLLHYPPPKPRLWGWDQNVPTLGISALTLASLLCDEVSLAGFGYNLSQKRAPLHYYESQPMVAMEQQTMHNLSRETELLRDLVKKGAVTDLTGALHCSFCPT